MAFYDKVGGESLAKDPLDEYQTIKDDFASRADTVEDDPYQRGTD